MNLSFDEETIRNYCLHHELERPIVSFRKGWTAVCLAVVLAVAASMLLHQLTGLTLAACLDICLGLTAMGGARHILTFTIRCYQRYAPDSIRRQCSCMPSCSEYALLALDKYLWPKALWKIWRRVTHTCLAPGYHLDYP